MYLILSTASPFLSQTVWVVGAVYYVLSVHMTPIELVLAGTVLEASYLLSQLPTGVFADTVSRRIAVVAGIAIVGSCWLFEGLVPVFVAILGAEVIRGVGEAFVDGAETAWLSDEVGAERMGGLMLRGTQLGQAGGIAGTLVGVALGSIHLNLPMAAGGGMLLLLAAFLFIAMPEHGFRPVPRTTESRAASLTSTFGSGIRLIRGHHVLMTMAAATLVWGAFSEGFDRLWEAHILRDVTLPALHGLKTVVWFGMINLAASGLAIAAAEIARRIVAIDRDRMLGRTLIVVNGILATSVITFGLARGFGLALTAFLLASSMRTVSYPLYSTWLNRQVQDSSVRATVLSVVGGANSLGQLTVGPIVGAIGTLASLRAAITTSGCLLLPILPLYARILHLEPGRHSEGAVQRADEVFE